MKKIDLVEAFLEEQNLATGQLYKIKANVLCSSFIDFIEKQVGITLPSGSFKKNVENNQKIIGEKVG